MIVGLVGFAFLYSYGKMRYSEFGNYTPKYVSNQIELPPIKYERKSHPVRTFLKFFAFLWFGSGVVAMIILYNLFGMENYYKSLTGPPWAHIRDLTYQEAADEHFYSMMFFAAGFYLILIWLPLTIKFARWFIALLLVKTGAEYIIDYAKK